jgi:hypothetical protein
LGELGQERCDEVFPRAKAEVGEHQEQHRKRERSGPGKCEQGGRDHATGRGKSEQALFCGAQVGVGSKDGSGQQD